MEAVRSQASQGLVVTYVEFGWDVEVRSARQIVWERLATVAGQLPPDIVPLMTPPSSIMGQVMHAGMVRQAGPGGGTLAPVDGTTLMAERVPSDVNTDPTTDNGPTLAVWQPRDRHDPATWDRVPITNAAWTGEQTAAFDHDGKSHAVTFRTPEQLRMDMRTIADWVVRPRLLKEKGVAEVIVLGGDRKQYQVLVDPDKLLEYGVTIQDVDAAIGANNLNASGSFTEEGQVERPVRVIARLGPEPAKVLADLRMIPVRSNAVRSVRLGQVATVAEAAGPGPRGRRRRRPGRGRHHDRQTAARRHPGPDRPGDRASWTTPRPPCRPTR